MFFQTITKKRFRNHKIILAKEILKSHNSHIGQH
nr:MAG TPA: hypothetical protein [Caudoviricetes sp.]DAQ81119.1 MAG TPA: hypothetical protein [Caudoviricetes sp.]DAQ93013.1 MAG TPA: hypothetical protein [Caudoviricetes sp.]